MRSRLLRAAALALALLAAGSATANEVPDRLAGLRARLIGPAGMSGRVAAIDAVVSNPDVVYVGAATGGVWKSVNGGTTFTPVFDDQPVHAIGAIAVYQPNTDIVWVGTGEGNVRNSASVGNGVYRSLDGGRTWKHLGLEATERIHRIALDPRSPDTAYVCAPGREWGENPERGVFKTTDGGRTWQKVLYVDEKTGCGDMAMDPSNPQKLLASMWQFRRWPYFFKSGGPGSGLHVTHDGGATWRKVQEEDGLPKGELGRIGLAIAPSNPTVVYAIVEAEKSAVLRSDDGGRKWTKVNEKPDVAPRPFYFNELRVDPKTPDRVFSLDYQVRVSEDGGKTWGVLPGAAWSQIHGDHHALWIDPNDPERMYNGNDGGVAVSQDGGRTFRFVENLPLAQYYHVAVDHETPYHVYGGLQDNGSWRGPSWVRQQGGIRNYHWVETGTGDGFETLPHPREPGVGYSLWQGGNLARFDMKTGEQRAAKPAGPEGVKLRFNWNAGLATDPFEPDTVYVGSQFLHKSTDRGETWTTLGPDLTTNNPEWQKQEESGGLTPDVTAAENHTTLIAIAPSPVERGVIWVGSDDGRVHVTRDGGKTWTSVEKNLRGVPANTWVPHIEASPHVGGTAFAVFDNHRRSDLASYVQRTDDYGRTWTSLATPELRGYALVLRQDPVQKDLLFLGTEFGLYVSFNGGRGWTHLKKTIPTASVHDLVIHPREHDLVIATHGRAIWILDDIRPLRAMSETALAEPFRVYEGAPARQYWRRNEEGGFGFGATAFRGENRPYGAIVTWSMNLPGLPLHDEEKERERRERERQAERLAASRQDEPKRPGALTPPAEPSKPAAEPAKPATAAAGEARPEAKKKGADDEPKVDIEVADASGKVVRRFKAPARQGVNRAVWDLRRDAFKQPPRPPDAPPQTEEPAGPELPPGGYTITVKYAEHQGRQAFQVLGDDRSSNTEADWRKRWEVIERTGALNDRLVDAIVRVRRAREDAALVQARVRQDAEAAGERDKKKLDDLPLVKAGETLKDGLTAVEKRLWPPPESKGFVAETSVMSRLFYPTSYVQSSWAPPSPTHLEHLRQAEAALQAVLGDVDRFFASDVAAFRSRVQEAGIALLAGPTR